MVCQAHGLLLHLWVAPWCQAVVPCHLPTMLIVGLSHATD